MRIKTNQIILWYTCKTCNDCTNTTQPLTDIVECGTPICPNCDRPMTLDDEAILKSIIITG